MPHSSKQPQHCWPPGVPNMVWAPLAAGALMVLAGGIGLAFGQPPLFPSLGPTAFLQTETPELRTARFYNTVVGHLIGLAAGLVARKNVDKDNPNSERCSGKCHAQDPGLALDTFG